MNTKKSKTGSNIWHVLFLLLLVWVSYSVKDTMTYSDVEPIISMLQNSAAMIFTIMGIWIAYVYPNAILKITQPSKVDVIFSRQDESRVTMLVGVVILSASVICLLMVGLTVRPLLLKTSFYLNFSETINFLGLFCLLALVYAQTFSIYIVIASNVNFIFDLRNLRNKELNNRRLDKSLNITDTSRKKRDDLNGK